jgi:hypothetical protein
MISGAVRAGGGWVGGDRVGGDWVGGGRVGGDRVGGGRVGGGRVGGGTGAVVQDKSTMTAERLINILFIHLGCFIDSV